MNFTYEFYRLILIFEYRKYLIFNLTNHFFLYFQRGFLGFTNAGPSVFMNNFDKLPSNDLMALYDRPEFWIFNDDAFDEKLSELDEYRFVFDKGGDFHMWRNNESERPTKTVAFADKDQIFYPFFFLNGRITALALMGIVSSTKRTRNPPKKEEKDEDAGLCQICLDSKANCVMIPCGHVFYCSDCRGSCETKFGKTCPTCQKAYENVFEIEDD